MDDIETFAAFTGDDFYAHMDEDAAAANPFFPGRVAHGYLLVSWAAGLFVDAAPGPVLANSGLENLKFVTPVSAGDSIRVELTAKQITPARDRRLRRGALGCRAAQPERRARGVRTTCSRWSRRRGRLCLPITRQFDEVEHDAPGHGR